MYTPANLKNYVKTLKEQPLIIGFTSIENIYKEFDRLVDNKIKFCYACYDNEDYEGDAALIYYRTDTKKYYEVYGSHCSCSGLEDQWTGDEEIVFEELLNRLNNPYLYSLSSFKYSFEQYLKR